MDVLLQARRHLTKQQCYVYWNLAYSTGYFHGMTGPVPWKEVVFRDTPRGGSVS